MIKKRRKSERHKPEFIERAVAMAQEIGPTRAAKALGVRGTLVRHWLGRAQRGRYVTPDDSPEQRELAETRKENFQLKRENEDLKKANIILRELASFFTKDHPHSSLEWSLSSLKKKNSDSASK